MIKFNVVTMKDGEINIKEKPELSELLSQAMNEEKEEKSYLNESMKEAIKSHGEFMKRKKERAMELPEGFYKNDKNSEFFTSSLETMKDIITDEVKRDKILQRISEGNKFGTFKRFKTQQPFLVRAYKTRKGAEQNTFWRNRWGKEFMRSKLYQP